MRRVITVEEIPSREEMLGWVRSLSEGPRRLAGVEGGRRAEETIAGWFRKIGLQGVAREAIPLQTWQPEEARLECGGAVHPAYPLARSRFTGEEGLEAPLVWVGQGDPESLEGRDLEGRIVVAEVPFAPRPYQLLRKTAHAVHDPEGTFQREPQTRATWLLPTFARAYAFSAARGAAGFVGILKDLLANRHRYHYPYVGPQEVLSTPGAFLGRDDGAEILKRLRAGPAEGRLVTTGRIAPGQSRNILGFLPGVGDGVVLVTSHHDSPFGGCVEDSSGLAVMLAVARHFARKKRDDRPLSLVFLAAAGNFTRNMGARDFLARHAHDIVPRLVLTLTLEHIGLEAEERNGRLVPTGQVEPRGVFVSDRPELLDLATLAILGNDLRRSFIVPVPPDGTPVDGEAGPYFAAGLPAIGLVSGPEYLLTDDDGPGWLAEDELVPVAKTAIEVLEAFMSQS